MLGAAGERVFTYGTERGTPDGPVLVAPVVVVVDAASGVVPPADYMAWASQGAVLVRDPQTAVASAREAGLVDFVTSFRPARQEAADVYAQVVRELRLHLANCAAALLVLLATAVGLGQVYTRAHAQRLFVSYVHGRSLVRTHPGLLAAEGALLVGVGVASAAATAALLGAGPGEGSGADADLALGGLQPLLASAWAVLSAGLVVAALVVHAAQLRRAAGTGHGGPRRGGRGRRDPARPRRGTPVPPRLETRNRG